MSGSVVVLKPTGDVLNLSIKDAIQMGLKYNLGVLLSTEGNEAARGAKIRALAELLPNLSARVGGAVQQVSLAQFGFPATLTGGKLVIGPFAYFDARTYLTQSVFNYTALQNNHAADENLKAANLDYRNTRDLVVLVSGASYLQAVAATSRVDAAQAEFTTAKATYDRAVNLHTAGVIPAIDVLRAQVQMQSQQQRLLAAKNDFERSKLSLARVIGLPTAQQFALSDKIPYAPLPPVSFDDELKRAYDNRSDYKAAQARVKAAEDQRKAAVGERIPTVAINGDYGVIGPHFTQANGTFTAAGGINIPIFQGGRARGDITQADALLKQRNSELENLRGQIEYDLRTAFLDVQTAAEQIDVAGSTVKLAHDQLEQSQDRFSAGVADNLEVIQAQQAVAVANENYISSLYAHNFAKLSLVRAVGVAETAVMNFLGGK
ncbi:TolC family protein [Candidatus Korobacter versatilis]|uniref:TolC family protein n=1 Tax=Candidatus Korobacter versatilis TaxID=658062 RepID=UPI0002E5DA4F|nr:TolC family protein [Candidatus Koribacter versatilis]